MDNESALIFDHAIRTADILVEMFGANCEVAVHDFSNLESSLIHLSGTLTGRSIGSPITDLVLEQLQKKVVTDYANYKTVSPKGSVMKSSTVFLKNQKDEVLGALCINFDISNMMQMEGVLKDFITFESDKEQKESFHTDVHEVIQSMTQQALDRYYKPPALLETDEKVEVVRELETKGAFLIKGATEYAASAMGVSKFTIYNYLQKVRTDASFNSK